MTSPSRSVELDPRAVPSNDDGSDAAHADHLLAKRIVERQLNRSGNTLLCAMEPLPADVFYAGGPNGVSPAWTVGHIACVLDLFGSWLNQRELLLPKPAHDVFNPLDIVRSRPKTKAESVSPSTFSRADIVYFFRTAQVTVLDQLATFDLRRWDKPTPGPAPDNLPTCGHVWEHLGVHTYWHLGELAATVSAFHGSYTLNMVPHYFYVPPGRDDLTP